MFKLPFSSGGKQWHIFEHDLPDFSRALSAFTKHCNFTNRIWLRNHNQKVKQSIYCDCNVQPLKSRETVFTSLCCRMRPLCNFFAMCILNVSGDYCLVDASIFEGLTTGKAFEKVLLLTFDVKKEFCKRFTVWRSYGKHWQMFKDLNFGY